MRPLNTILVGSEPPAARRNGKPTAAPQRSFPESIPASALERIDCKTESIWSGYLYREVITLLSSKCKAGKTTWLALLLRALHDGTEFCGRPVLSSRVLYVTEESQTLWADRRDRLGLADNVRFLDKPFFCTPDVPRWNSFIAHVAEDLQRNPADLVVFDTIGNLWPAKDENWSRLQAACGHSTRYEA
jgi:hypothetical protein